MCSLGLIIPSLAIHFSVYLEAVVVFGSVRGLSIRIDDLQRGREQRKRYLEALHHSLPGLSITILTALPESLWFRWTCVACVS